MKKLFGLILLALSIVLSPSLLLSQEEETVKDTTLYIDEDREINIDTMETNQDEFFDFKEFKFRFRKESHPYLLVRGGLNQFAHKSVIQNFRQLGSLEVQLGYTRSFKKSRSYLISNKDRYVGFNLNNKNLYKSSSLKPIELSNYQLSIGQKEDYGYKIKDVKLLFGTGKEFNWTHTTLNQNIGTSDTLILNFYKDALRFGEAYNSEFSFQLFDFVSLQANYKYGIIFPRHLFWKHLGSYVIEEAVKSLLGEYLERVFSMRPAAGPIVNFVLQSSLNYLFYELKKERMNWPFKTVQPLTYDIYTFGVKFTF